MSIFLKKLHGLNSIVLGVVATATAFTTSAQAADFSFRGNFSTDDEVQLFDFTVGANSTVTLKTLSYAGGTQADGTTISAGGFDPILALFDSAGTFINDNDDGFSPNVGIDPATGAEFDTFLQVNLNPGDYTVAVSQFDNFFDGNLGDNISSGFVQEGNPTFTSGFGSCSNGQFCDVFGDNRTNEWAFDVLNVDNAVVDNQMVIQPPVSENVPEPSTILGSLLILGLNSTLRKRNGE